MKAANARLATYVADRMVRLEFAVHLEAKVDDEVVDEFPEHRQALRGKDEPKEPHKKDAAPRWLLWSVFATTQGPPPRAPCVAGAVPCAHS